MSIVLTNATAFSGPGFLEIYDGSLGKLYCHDSLFADSEKRDRFEEEHKNCIALSGQSPTEICSELESLRVTVTKLINNDVHPNFPKPIEEISVDEYRMSIESLFLFPIELTGLLLPRMKQSSGASIVFVTSARYLNPEEGFTVATSVRQATSAYAVTLAKEVASSNIQVNVVAPNYLYSEAYYPKAVFKDSDEGREKIRKVVPMGRLGEPREIGELIHFLISDKSRFVTGQIINFTGGWGL